VAGFGSANSVKSRVARLTLLYTSMKPILDIIEYYNFFSCKYMQKHAVKNVLLDLIESKMVNLGGSQWQCTDCHQVMKKTNLVLHIESKHIGHAGGFSCGDCGKYCSTRKALSIHKSRYQHHGVGI